jgi:CHAT domain-containing protein
MQHSFGRIRITNDDIAIVTRIVHDRALMLKITALLIAQATLPVSSAPTLDLIQTSSVAKPLDSRAAAEAIDLVKDPKVGRAAWERVLQDAVTRKLPLVARAEIVNKIADTFYYEQRPADAIKPLEDIVAQLLAAGDGSSAAMADSLSNLGLMYDETGHPERNLAYQKQALDIFERLKGIDPARVASTSINYAAALMGAGRAYEGAPHALRAVELYRQAGIRDATVAIATGTAANIAVLGGRAEVAIPLAEEAVRIAHEVLPPDNPYYGFAEATLGKSLMLSGRLDEAEPHLRLGLDVLGKTAGRRNSLTLQVMQNLGVMLYDAGRLDEAIGMTVAAAEAQAGSKSLNDAQSLSAASSYASELGDEERAAEFAKRAFDRVQATPDATGSIVAAATRRYGEIEAAAGRFDMALPLLTRAAGVAGVSMPDADGRNAQADIQLAAAEIRAGKTIDGLVRLEASVARLKQRMVRYAPITDLNEDAFTYYNDFATAAGAAIDLGRLDLALEYQQLATWGLNARTAQQVVLRGRVARDTKLAALVRQVQEDGRQARLLRRNYTSLIARGNTVSATSMAAEIARLDARVKSNEAVLARRVPGYGDSRSPTTIDLATIQQRLTGNDSILIAVPTRYELLLFAITSTGATADKVRLGRGNLRAMVAKLRRSVDDGLVDDAAEFDVAAAYSLHQAIFTPKIRAALRAGGTLHTLTNDALATFSLAMLVREPAGERLKGTALAAAHWLVRDYAIETPMSLATMTIARSRRGARQTFVGVGAPTLSGAVIAPIEVAALYRGGGGGADSAAISALPTLPNARLELTQMAAVIAPRHHILLTGADATEARVRTIDWRGQSVIAFATHGLLAGEIGSTTEPALVLTPGAGTPGLANDGLLTASEILTMNLDSDLVILSACNSASGISRISAPYTGLANAFLFAGARSLLISHWPLRDDMAARLSVETVRGMRAGMVRAEALRQAQIAVLQDTAARGAAHPAAWASFVMVAR